MGTGLLPPLKQISHFLVFSFFSKLPLLLLFKVGVPEGYPLAMFRLTFFLLQLGAFISAEASRQNWPNLRTTFGRLGSGSAFVKQPRTESEASSAGWRAIGHCTGKFLGHRYADPSDPSLVMIYDDAGYIAGVQSVLLEKDIDMSVNNHTKQAVYVKDVWMGEEAWFTTAYFVDPILICNGGRSSSDWANSGTGDRLLIQSKTLRNSTLNGTENLISIPLTQAEANITSDWNDHFCFPGMGEHYHQFDYTPDQACDSVLPLQILYNEGVLSGFVWQHSATLPGDRWERPNPGALSSIFDRPPTCIFDHLKYPGVSTMHHYFYDDPWLTECPFNQPPSPTSPTSTSSTTSPSSPTSPTWTTSPTPPTTATL